MHARVDSRETAEKPHAILRQDISLAYSERANAMPGPEYEQLKCAGVGRAGLKLPLMPCCCQADEILIEPTEVSPSLTSIEQRLVGEPLLPRQIESIAAVRWTARERPSWKSGLSVSKRTRS
jgi:hypothetical protein